ncbi:hypothetical protein PHYSODRAFT_301052 [Phytophthora sojae]|uniref:Uncharacterized protein n=1 Tax=Phytophthora sojae (strain P6497) TaxID=1094619 RepID=G4ZDK7_PHYSP|nr:hypothetical protein PHYSODRAFT_301052 [Phytophthora sojae]EGZ18346.1 hypothetical protein PHYSODRAFT_301052 [Phytophthora sojae]|eukprot:XP_009527404.1 hypothetical protein PHYSODRAFT_301052 [Phytophthora sojae]
MLVILAKKYGSFAGDALRHAVANHQREVQKLLLEMCEEKYLREPRMARCMTSMLEQATTEDDLEVGLRLFVKCGEVGVGHALRACWLRRDRAASEPQKSSVGVIVRPAIENWEKLSRILDQLTGGLTRTRIRLSVK